MRSDAGRRQRKASSGILWLSGTLVGVLVSVMRFLNIMRKRKKAGKDASKLRSNSAAPNNPPLAQQPSPAQQPPLAQQPSPAQQPPLAQQRLFKVFASKVFAFLSGLIIVGIFVVLLPYGVVAGTRKAADATATAITYAATSTSVARLVTTATAIEQTAAAASTDTAIAKVTAAASTVTAVAYEKQLMRTTDTAAKQFAQELISNLELWGQPQSGLRVEVEQKTPLVVQYFEKGRMDYKDGINEVWGGPVIRDLLGRQANGQGKHSCAAIFGDAQGETYNPVPSYRDAVSITGNLSRVYQPFIKRQNDDGYVTVIISHNQEDDSVSYPLEMQNVPTQTIASRINLEDVRLTLEEDKHHIPMVFCNHIAKELYSSTGRPTPTKTESPCNGNVLKYPDQFWRVTGRPIGEPMWTQAHIGTITTNVMFQAFERRMLIYYIPISMPSFSFAPIKTPVAGNFINVNQARIQIVRTATPSSTVAPSPTSTMTPTPTPEVIIQMTNAGTDYWNWIEGKDACPDQSKP
jgi:hypothetical protein